MKSGSTDEIPLTGGNMTAVVRVGDTVRRAAGPRAPTIHALLRHVRANGFTACPEPLGFDEEGREILTFLPGEVPSYPLPDYVLSDATLGAVARMLRAYHDATLGFAGDDEVVCHNDFAPYNLVFEHGKPAGVIDFDAAAPGPRLRDVAYAAYRFVPLTDPANPDVPYPGAEEQRRRLDAFQAAYGETGDVIAAAIERLRELIAFTAQRSTAAHNAIYERDVAYLSSLGTG